jgi:hypothetical protein
MYKIILNTMPRTAGFFFFDLIRDMYGHNKRDGGDPRIAGEWSQTDNWIILCHEPLLFRAELPGVTMTTVLRNPIDAVTSQILKTSYGFGGATIAGRPEIVDGNMAFFRDKKEEFIKESMYQESRMWEGYTYGSMLAIDRIVPFTFEQVTEDLPNVLPHLYRLAGGTGECSIKTQEQVDQHLAGHIEHAKNDINYSSGAANAFPVDKPEDYYIIREMVERFHLMPKLQDDYEKALIAFDKRQTDLGIK